jgi:hypothetical protein
LILGRAASGGPAISFSVSIRDRRQSNAHTLGAISGQEQPNLRHLAHELPHEDLLGSIGIRHARAGYTLLSLLAAGSICSEAFP